MNNIITAAHTQPLQGSEWYRWDKNAADPHGLLQRVNQALAGAGELSLIVLREGMDDSYTHHEAYLYLWGEQQPEFECIADWFVQAGAVNVQVAWTMLDTLEGIYVGHDPAGHRHLVVKYTMPVISA